MDEKKLGDMCSKLPDGSYKGVCPVCGIELTLTVNWWMYVAVRVLQALIAGGLTVCGLWLYR